MRFVLLGLAVFVVYSFWTCVTQGGSVTRSFEMGMIYWPPQGEATPRELIGKGIGLAVTNSDHLLVQLPWSPVQTNLTELANWISTVARENRKHLTIAVDWLEPARTGVRAGKTNPWRFGDETTRSLFLQSVVAAAAKHQPEYFVIGVEVNYYAHLCPDDFVAFTRTFRDARMQIKKVAPRTKVLVTFQYELLTGRDKSWGTTRELGPINVLRGDLDVLGISTYPFLAGMKPRDVSRRYFDVLDKFHMPVAIFETAWPTPTTVAQQEQAEYVERILSACNAMKARLLIWTAATDTSELSATLTTGAYRLQSNWISLLGLWEMDCRSKKAVSAWEQWQRLPCPSDVDNK